MAESNNDKVAKNGMLNRRIIMKWTWKNITVGATLLIALCLANAPAAHAVKAVDYAVLPPFLHGQSPPLVMLVMGKNHKLFYEAYDDITDLNNDGVLDVGYHGEAEYYEDTDLNHKWDPGEFFLDRNYDGQWTDDPIDYYGYFNSHICYLYDFQNKRFEPESYTENKKCPGTGNNLWSGDFLNYMTMTRMDAMRKVLYGGRRSVDS